MGCVRRRRPTHGGLAEPAALVLEQQPDPSLPFAVGLDGHRRTQSGFEQIHEIGALIKQHAPLPPPCTGHMPG